MTDPTSATRADDEQHGEDVDLRPTGLVRFHSHNLDGSPRTWRLRRPFFGELKRLRLSLENLADEIQQRSQATVDVGFALAENAEAMGKMPEEERRARTAELRAESRRVGRELTEYAEAARIGWWREVFEVLSLDGGLPEADDELPGWIVSQELPAQVLQHWRSVPLGRG